MSRMGFIHPQHHFKGPNTLCSAKHFGKRCGKTSRAAVHREYLCPERSRGCRVRVLSVEALIKHQEECHGA